MSIALQREIVLRGESPQLEGDAQAILTRILRHRQLNGDADAAAGSLAQLLPPAAMHGMPAAVSLLVAALREKQRILIVGDYDVDGATATSVAMGILKEFGATVDFIVPNRFTYGYGLSPEIAKVALQRQPNLLITVDNGIASVEGVDVVKAAGVKVLITDHHLPGAQLPKADAIVNPNQPACDFPSKSMAGVGVLFYVMLALRAELRQSNWFAEHDIAEPNLADYLDLVALGTVADVVKLDKNNRILVAQGLARIRCGQGRVGINALLSVASRDPQHIIAQDLGFTVAPRLNAAGRLDDITLGIDCLCSNDQEQAYEYALRLHEINEERKKLQATMQQQAMAQLDLQNQRLDDDRKAFCFYDEQWHEGVTGLVASRLKDRCNRPVIAMAKARNGELKGSARSIEEVHIKDALEWVASQYPGLLIRFGGHAMAAGLTIAESDFAQFNQAFEAAVGQQLGDVSPQLTIMSDGVLPEHAFATEAAALIKYAAPWGHGFPMPQFHGDFVVVSQRIVGLRHLKLTLTNATSGRSVGQSVDAIVFFYQEPDAKMPPLQYVRLVYQLDINHFRGQQSVQLIVQQLQALDPELDSKLGHKFDHKQG